MPTKPQIATNGFPPLDRNAFRIREDRRTPTSRPRRFLYHRRQISALQGADKSTRRNQGVSCPTDGRFQHCRADSATRRYPMRFLHYRRPISVAQSACEYTRRHDVMFCNIKGRFLYYKATTKLQVAIKAFLILQGIDVSTTRRRQRSTSRPRRSLYYR